MGKTRKRGGSRRKRGEAFDGSATYDAINALSGLTSSIQGIKITDEQLQIKQRKTTMGMIKNCNYCKLIKGSLPQVARGTQEQRQVLWHKDKVLLQKHKVH